MLFLNWFNETRKELKALVTGSLLLGILGLYQGMTGKTVAGWLYATVFVFFLGWTFFGSWSKQYKRAHEAESKIIAERERLRLSLHLPHLKCGIVKNIGLIDDHSYGVAVTVSNDEMGYASTARDLYASVRFCHALSEKEVVIEKGVWHWHDRTPCFGVNIALAMGEQRDLVLFTWLADKAPRTFAAMEPGKTILEYGKWEIEVTFSGDNVIPDTQKLEAVVLTPAGGIGGVY